MRLPIGMCGRRLGMLLLLSPFLAAVVVFYPAPAQAAAPPPLTEGWTQVVKGGFTDPNNAYAPTSATFKDYLYISTSANESTAVFSGSSKAGGDIWRTADGVTWEQVGTAGLGNPHNYFFQLIVFRDKLYAISNNINDHGIEIWVTSDGTQFTKIESGGFGDKSNDWAYPFVFQDRLILGLSNGDTGGEIWVSDDGQTFRQVADGGMGDPGVTGFGGFADPEHADPIFQGMLYMGVSNPDRGGEIWRTADGLEWERVADNGLTRSTTKHIAPDIVYQDQLYAFATAGGTIDNLLGFDLFRTTDGTTWEQVVDNGFNAGKERNVSGDLVEFKGRLYLTSNTMDPRVLMPTKPYDRLPPRGFQLRVSDDGKTWTQIGEDGFGLATSIVAGLNVIGDTLYLGAFDYHQGSQLWRSSDGQKWELLFRESNPNFFQEGGGPLDFKGHLLWFSNDLKKGLAIWRTDEVMVAEATTTTAGETSTTSGGKTNTSAGGTGTSDGGAGGTGSGDKGSPSGIAGSDSSGTVDGSESGGLSGGWIALIAVLAVLVVAGLAALAFLLGKRARGPRAAGAAVAGVDATSSAAFCKECGASLSPGSKFCADCGASV